MLNLIKTTSKSYPSPKTPNPSPKRPHTNHDLHRA